jgi:3-methyladenine DNA glycosylase/8-oxoguanine DNA glycosylase
MSKPSGFAFDTDIAIAHLRASDAMLAKLIDRVGPFHMELKSASSLFDVLAEAIVYQQLHARAAASIHARVRALIPRTRGLAAARALSEISDEALRGAGLSRSKLLALRDLAAKTLDNHVPTLAKARRMDDEAIIEHLTQVRGIGRWTVQMLLMFRLGRPDVLPVGDYGVRKGFGVAFRKKEMPLPADVEKRGERWRPYRSVASWYLWRAAELA